METQSARTDDLFAVSAVTGDGMDALLWRFAEHLKDPRREEVFNLTFAEGRQRAWLFEQGIVTNETMTDDGYTLTVFWTLLQKERFSRMCLVTRRRAPGWSHPLPPHGPDLGPATSGYIHRDATARPSCRSSATAGGRIGPSP